MKIRVEKESLLKRINIQAVLDYFGIKANQNGKVRCPKKNEHANGDRTPSLHIHYETNSFCCYGCGRAGNAIDFFMLFSGVGFKEALRILEKNYGSNN